MHSPVNELLQNASELITGLPDWVYIPLTIGLVIGIPLMCCLACGGDQS